MNSNLGFLLIQYWGYFLLGSMCVFGFFTAWLAASKGYNYGLWLFLGACFGFVALISVGFAPTFQKTMDNKEDNNTTPKKKIRFGGLNDEL